MITVPGLLLLATLAVGAAKTPPVLEARAGEVIAAALGYGEADLPVGRHRLTGIRLEAERVTFVLAPAAEGPVASLVGVHPDAAAPGADDQRACQSGGLAVYAPASADSALLETARELCRRLPEVPWARPSLGPSATLPPSLEHLIAAPSTDGRPAWRVDPEVVLRALAWARGVPAALALVFALLVAWGVLRRARAVPLRGRLAWLATIGLGGLALRLALARPWPISFVEVERVLPTPECAFGFLPELLRPFLAWAADPLAGQGLANLAFSALAPVLAALLGEAWTGRRTGWVAGAFVAALPLHVLFARTSTAEVALSAFVLAAALATEELLRRPGWLTALAAALGWGLAVQFRPEGPGLLAAPALWLLVDARGRRWLAGWRHSVPLVGLVVAAGALAVVRFVACHGGASVAASVTDVAPHYLGFLGANAWDLLANPRWHDAALLVLAAVGVAVSGGAWRAPALLLGAVLPVALYSLKGPAVGSLAFDVTDLRYVLPSQPFLAVAAAAAVARVADLPEGRWRLGGAVSAAALALAVLAAPLAGSRGLAVPTALQAEHRALAQVAVQVPSDAEVLVFGPRETGAGFRRQLDYRFTAVARAGGGSCSTVRVIVADDVPAVPGGTPLYYWRGWFELLSAGPEVDAFQAWLGARFVREAVYEEQVEVAAGMGRVPMRLGLYRLRERVREVSPAP